MATARKKGSPANASAATIGYETELWRIADALGGSMDVAEYKHVSLGLSDTITHATLARGDVVTPSPRAADAFESELGPILNRVRAAILESLTPGAVRDSLVPELISGELRVNERTTQTVLEQAAALSLAWAA